MYITNSLAELRSDASRYLPEEGTPPIDISEELRLLEAASQQGEITAIHEAIAKLEYKDANILLGELEKVICFLNETIPLPYPGNQPLQYSTITDFERAMEQVHNMVRQYPRLRFDYLLYSFSYQKGFMISAKNFDTIRAFGAEFSMVQRGDNAILTVNPQRTWYEVSYLQEQRSWVKATEYQYNNADMLTRWKFTNSLNGHEIESQTTDFVYNTDGSYEVIPQREGTYE